MKTLACRDMGMDCDFKATGADDNEVIQKMMAHGAEAHADAGAGKSPEDMMNMMKPHIKEEA